MRRIEASVEIDAPLKEVFTFASDWRRWDDWWEGVSGFRPTTEITRGNGTRYAYKAWIAGMTFDLETEIHDFLENAGWRGIATKGPPHRTQWVFEAMGGGTRLTYILEYELPWPVLGPILDFSLVRPGWNRMLNRSLGNLKIRFEGHGSGSVSRTGVGMNEEGVRDVSKQQAGEEPQGLARLRDFTTDALRYWELRRLFYNLLLAAVVAGHFIAAWPASKSAITVDGVLQLFVLAVMANVAYSFVYVADVFIQVSGFRAGRPRWRQVLLLVGFAFAAVLAHFFATGIFAGRNGPG